MSSFANDREDVEKIWEDNGELWDQDSYKMVTNFCSLKSGLNKVNDATIRSPRHSEFKNLPKILWLLLNFLFFVFALIVTGAKTIVRSRQVRWPFGNIESFSKILRDSRIALGYDSFSLVFCLFVHSWKYL